MLIDKTSNIDVFFKIRLKDGTIAEDSRSYSDKAFNFDLGQGVFPDKVECDIIGKSIPYSSKIMLMPEDAYGPSHPANIYEVPLYKFPKEIDISVGSIISFDQKDGSEIPGVIKEVSENEATVDFNHPLAGQVVLVEIDVVKVYQ